MKTIRELSSYFHDVSWTDGGSGFKAKCPHHDDKKASLHVKEDNGKMLLCCHAKCPTEDILKDIGLSWSDILPDREVNRPRLFKDWYRLDKKHPVTAEYDYTDENGKYLYTNFRFSLPGGKKDFRQFILNEDRTDVIKNEDGRRIWGKRNRKSLFNLPNMLQEIRRGGTVFVTEGEKDVLTLQNIGLVATTSGGANTWTDSFAKYFEGANVVLLPDNDKAGEDYADMVQDAITSVTKSLKRITVSSTGKGDVTDYLTKEGGTKELLLQMVAVAPDIKSVRVTDEDDTHYYEDFYEYNQHGTPTKTIDIKICRWICKNYTFFIMGDLPYFIDDHNQYVLDEGGVRMKRIIQSCIVPRLNKDGTVTSIYRMILYQNRRKSYEELNQYPVEWVPFRNGFYDPVADKMIPILPGNYVINQIPHDFYPGANVDSPVFDELLRYQLPNEDEHEQWLQFGGTCFNRDTSPQKWMIIKGGGGTGKSTQLNVLIDCIGSDNVSNETLQGLNERFNATALFGKLVNICADISSEDMKRIDVLKKVTGEDRNGVKYERKGKDAFFFSPFCKLLFSANEIPLNRDEKSNAFYRRLMITVMDRKPAKVDRNLHKKLTAELDGIIHRYMEGLRRFYQRGGYYVESARSVSEVEQLRRSADSVIAFFDDELIDDASGKIERTELYDAYKQYCEREERRYPVTNRTLFERLRDRGVTETKTNGGSRYFMGIRFRQQDEGQQEFIFVTTDTKTPFD